MKFSQGICAIGVGTLAVGAVLLMTQAGQAQDGHPLPFPDLSPVVVTNLTDSWNVQVKNACLVDSETVKAGSVRGEAEENFQVDAATRDSGEAKNTEQGKNACKEAVDKARKDLASDLFEQGDRLCQQWTKAPVGKKKGDKKDQKECRAVRGNLHGPDIRCSCEVERQTPGRQATTNWKAKATCTAPDVKYVCDP